MQPHRTTSMDVGSWETKWYWEIRQRPLLSEPSHELYNTITTYWTHELCNTITTCWTQHFHQKTSWSSRMWLAARTNAQQIWPNKGWICATAILSFETIGRPREGLGKIMSLCRSSFCHINHPCMGLHWLPSLLCDRRATAIRLVNLLILYLSLSCCDTAPASPTR